MQRLRKSFRSIRRRCSRETSAYKIITDFETKTEKECVKQDEENSAIYAELLAKAKKARKSIKNSGLQMSLEVPPPPVPNNRDRYILWKKRNISEKVIPQSDAVYFLTKEGYELNKDYEAYQAIHLAEQIRKEKGIKVSNVDISKDFTNVYTSTDQNILRRFSIYGMEEFNKARENAVRNSMMDEESYQFGNRTCSMPNIYHRNRLSQEPLRERSNSLTRSPLCRSESYENRSSSSASAPSLSSSQCIPSAPSCEAESSKDSESLYPKVDC